MLGRSNAIESTESTSTSTGALCVGPPLGGGGEAEHGVAEAAELRGVGAAAEKSLELASVSVQPSPARSAEVVLPIAGAAPVPSESVAEPYPTRSVTSGSAEQLPPQASGVTARDSATLPPETARLDVPVASGMGSGPPTAPDASWTR